MILPVIEYCDIIYEETSAKNLSKINGGLRICIRNHMPQIKRTIEKGNCAYKKCISTLIVLSGRIENQSFVTEFIA